MSASASASASTSTNPPSLSPALPPTPSIRPSNAQSSTSSHPQSNASTHPSTLPHSPETLRQIAEARAALEASMLNIGNNLSADLKSRAQNLHSNSAQLDKQMKDVEKSTKALKGQNDKLGRLAGDGMTKMKELGNVQNWAEMLERDFMVLEETLRLAKKGEEEGSDWSGSYSGSGSESYSGSEDGQRDDESLEGDRRRERIGKGFGVNDEEMGFLDVYGLSEDSAMEGVEIEHDEIEEGRVDGFGDSPIGGTEKNFGPEPMDESGDMKMDSKPVTSLDKGKGKEHLDAQANIENPDGSSTVATGSSSEPSSRSNETAPPSAASST